MGPLHCPLCIGLGLMSISRCLAWGRLIWILRPAAPIAPSIALS